MQTAVNGKLKGRDEPSKHGLAFATLVEGGWWPKAARPSAPPRNAQQSSCGHNGVPGERLRSARRYSWQSGEASGWRHVPEGATRVAASKVGSLNLGGSSRAGGQEAAVRTERTRRLSRQLRFSAAARVLVRSLQEVP